MNSIHGQRPCVVCERTVNREAERLGVAIDDPSQGPNSLALR